MCTQPANFPAEENLDFAVIVLHRSLTLGPLNQVGHRCKTLLTFDNFSCSEWRPGGADDPVLGRRRVGWTKLEGSWTPGDERRLSARKICGLCRFSLFVLCPFIHSIKMVSYWWWFLKAPDLELSKDDTHTHREKERQLRPSGPRLCGLLSFVSFKGLSSLFLSVCFYGLHNNGGTLLSFLSGQWKGYMLAARMRMPSSSLLRFYVMKLLETH